MAALLSMGKMVLLSSFDRWWGGSCQRAGDRDEWRRFDPVWSAGSPTALYAAVRGLPFAGPFQQVLCSRLWLLWFSLGSGARPDMVGGNPERQWKTRSRLALLIPDRNAVAGVVC